MLRTSGLCVRYDSDQTVRRPTLVINTKVPMFRGVSVRRGDHLVPFLVMDPIVYIDRIYDDGFDEDPPWPRRRRWSPLEPEW
jgi:hypothetical protein